MDVQRWRQHSDLARRSPAILFAVVLLAALGWFPGEAGAAAPKVGWGGRIPIDTAAGPSGGFAALSCASSRFCAAVDVQGDALTFNGTKWSRRRNIDSDVYGFSSVSCPRSTFCFAADVTGEGVEWNGQRWSAPRTFDPDPQSTPTPAVSCATPTFCAAVDNFGYALLWHGSTWTHTVLVDGLGDPLELEDVSCPTSDFCAAVDGAGDFLTWNGSKWSAPRDVNKGAELLSVSCVSSAFCAAAGFNALVLTRHGTSWSVRSADVSGVAIVSVSCAEVHFCVATDYVGDAYVWNGARWRSDGQPGEGSGMLASCRSSDFCAGVTGQGQGLFYATLPHLLKTSMHEAALRHAYSATMKGTGGVAPYSFRALAGMPPGLKLSTTGHLHGTPTKTGHFTITVAVRDPLAESSKTKVSLTVS